MNRLLILIAIICTPLLTNAQQADKEHKYAIKINLQTTYDDFDRPASQFGIKNYQQDFIKPTIAFQLRNQRRNLHEIELSTVHVNEKNFSDGYGWGVLYTTRIAMQYEYIIGFLKNVHTRIKPSLGLSAMPYYDNYTVWPSFVKVNTYREQHIGIRGFVIPHVSYSISKRVFADLNIPICLFNAGQFYRSNQKPYGNGYSSSGPAINDYQVLPVYFAMRLGVGVKL